MFIRVTPEMCPVLAADTRNKWTEIGKEYYQTDNNDGITLEIRHVESGLFRWWLYDDKSPEPDLAVTMSDPDKATLEEALADVYDWLSGYDPKTHWL